MSATHTSIASEWRVATIGSVCSKPQYGWTTSAADSGDVKLLRTTDITHGPVNWSTVPYCRDVPPDVDKYLLADGDIVVSRAGSVGASCRVAAPERSVFASYLIRFRPKESVDGKYLSYVLQSPAYWTQVRGGTAGIAIPNVNASKLESFIFPLAPLPEQRRIVAEIEKQFTRLQAGVEALRRVQANLKRYRAAVLKAACEGRLVPTEVEIAKAENREFAIGEELLARILTARRQNWQGRGKYKEPATPDTTKLPQLPDGWTWASVEQISTKVVDGVHKKPNYVLAGIPFVTVRNLTAGPGISFEKLKYITPEDHEEFIKRANPELDDILVSKDGTLGVIRVIKTDVKFSIFVSVAMVKPVVREMSSFLGIALSSPQVQAQMVPKGSGLQHIHLEDLREDCIPLPPFEEQIRVVAEVERRLSVVEELEAVVSANLQRATRLRQSVLEKAFSP
jgi:type I restriction enzyme S subunit